jgi:hypothetical protein
MTKGTHVDARTDVGKNSAPGSSNRVPWGMGDGSGPAIQLRLTRTGNTFTFQRSDDGGKTFGSLHTGNNAALDTVTVSLPDDVLVGIALGGHNTSQVTTAVLGPFQFTQTATRPTTNGLVAATASDANGAPVAGESLIVIQGTNKIASSVSPLSGGDTPSNTASFFLPPGIYTIQTAETDKYQAGAPISVEVKTAQTQELKVAVGPAK